MKLLRSCHGLTLGILSIILFKLFQLYPPLVEAIFTNGLYKIIRGIYAYTLYFIPIPMMYFFVAFILFVLVRHYFRRRKKKNKVKSRFFIANFIGYTVVAFYFLWGFNYAREPFAQRTSIKVENPDADFLLQELLTVDSILIQIRKQITSNDTIALTSTYLSPDYQTDIRSTQKKVLESLGEPTYKNVQVRSLEPEGSLLRIKTAGIYFPFVLEGHIDHGLHPIEKPYVLAHEMAHANAITNEGVANFIGFLTCIHSDDPFVQYSGWLEYENYLYRTLRRNHKEVLSIRSYYRPNIVLIDQRAIRKQLEKFPDIMPKARDMMYNNYLKAQGISEGMASYAQIIQLCHSYKKKHGDYGIE